MKTSKRANQLKIKERYFDGNVKHMSFTIFVAVRHHSDIYLVHCKLSSANIPVFVDRNLNEKMKGSVLSCFLEMLVSCK